MTPLTGKGWPGAGLLVLRLTAAIPLILGGSVEFRGLPHSLLPAIQLVVISVGVLMLTGLWTPIAGALQAVIELWIVFSWGNAVVVHLLLAALGVSLAMIGPGAWSLDARLIETRKSQTQRPG